MASSYGLISSNDKKKLDNIIVINIPVTISISSSDTSKFIQYSDKDIYNYIMSLDLSAYNNIIVSFNNGYVAYINHIQDQNTGEGPARVLFGIISYYGTNYNISINATPDGYEQYAVEISISRLITYNKLLYNRFSVNGGVQPNYDKKLYITTSTLSTCIHFKFNIDTTDNKYAEIHILSGGKSNQPQIYIQNGKNMKFKIHVYYKDGYIKYVEYENTESYAPGLLLTSLCEYEMSVSTTRTYSITGYSTISKSSDEVESSGSSGLTGTTGSSDIPVYINNGTPTKIQNLKFDGPAEISASQLTIGKSGGDVVLAGDSFVPNRDQSLGTKSMPWTNVYAYGFKVPAGSATDCLMADGSKYTLINATPTKDGLMSADDYVVLHRMNRSYVLIVQTYPGGSSYQVNRLYLAEGQIKASEGGSKIEVNNTLDLVSRPAAECKLIVEDVFHSVDFFTLNVFRYDKNINVQTKTTGSITFVNNIYYIISQIWDPIIINFFNLQYKFQILT